MEQTARWTLSPIFDSYLLVAILLGVLTLLLVLRPRFRTTTPARTRMLQVVRALCLLVLAALMLRPTWIHVDQQRQAATVVLALDDSRSMLVEDAGSARSRWLAARETLAQVQPQIDRLRENYEVRFYTYSDRARRVVSSPTEATKLPLEPQGDASDMGAALEDVMRDTAGQRLAAIVLLGDGAQRVTEPRVEPRQPAGELARRGTAIYGVPFGQSRDRTQTRDVAVANLPDQYTVFVNNELIVRALINVRGYAERRMPVELVLTTPDGETETVGPQSLAVRASEEQTYVEFAYTPRQVGQFRLKVRVPPQIGEQVLENNELISFLSVLEGGISVLLVDGNVGWQERKFLRRALDASPDIQLNVLVNTRQRPGPLELPPGWTDDFDVLLLSDLGADVLGNPSAQTLAEAVNGGLGLMMLGGLQSFGPGGYAETPLQPVLPVEMNRLERQPSEGPIRADVHLTEELSMVPSEDHFITRLTAPGENERQWLRLPPLVGANRFTGVTPAGRVLAESPEGVPLLVRSQYGNGRVLAFAGDSTFRWYRRGFVDAHKRFWRQVVLWLAKKDASQQDEVWLTMPQRRFQPSQRASFRVGARDVSGEPVRDAEVEVTLTRPDGSQESLSVLPAEEDWSGTTPALTLPGAYSVTAVVRRGAQTLGTASGEFQVRDVDLELTDPSANPQQLAQVADISKASGGRLLAPEQLAKTLEQLNERLLDAQLDVEQRWQLTDTLPDAATLFGLLAGLLMAEWLLRKRWGMV